MNYQNNHRVNKWLFAIYPLLAQDLKFEIFNLSRKLQLKMLNHLMINLNQWLGHWHIFSAEGQQTSSPPSEHPRGGGDIAPYVGILTELLIIRREGDPYPFYLRPANSVTEWYLRHALTQMPHFLPYDKKNVLWYANSRRLLH